MDAREAFKGISYRLVDRQRFNTIITRSIVKLLNPVPNVPPPPPARLIQSTNRFKFVPVHKYPVKTWTVQQQHPVQNWATCKQPTAVLNTFKLINGWALHPISESISSVACCSCAVFFSLSLVSKRARFNPPNHPTSTLSTF